LIGFITIVSKLHIYRGQMEYMIKASAIVILMLLSITDCKKDEVFFDPELDPILEAMAPVCFEQGILKAGSFSGSPPHKIILLNSSGDKHTWSYSLPKHWWPTSIEETQLVACASEQKKETLSSCTYILIPSSQTAYLNRIGWRMKVELREARTGFIIASTELYTPLPACPSTWTFNGTNSTQELKDKVKLTDLEEWLRLYVNSYK
jgi:hypothetical protein